MTRCVLPDSQLIASYNSLKLEKSPAGVRVTRSLLQRLCMYFKTVKPQFNDINSQHTAASYSLTVKSVVVLD